jgi:hypothetical protein
MGPFFPFADCRDLRIENATIPDEPQARFPLLSQCAARSHRCPAGCPGNDAFQRQIGRRGRFLAGSVNRFGAAALNAAQNLKISVFFVPSIIERVPMNKLIAVLVAGLFATSVFAQTAAPSAPAAKAEAKAEKAEVKANKAEAKTDAKADAKAAAADAKAAKVKAAADAKAEKAKAKADAKAAKMKAAADAKAAKASVKANKAEAKTDAKADAKATATEAKAEKTKAKTDAKADKAKAAADMKAAAPK